MMQKKFWIICIISFLGPTFVCAQVTLVPDLTIVMRDPKGRIRNYTTQYESQFRGVKRWLPLGRQEWKKSLCRNTTPSEQLNFIEAQIELDGVINELNSLKKPRQLSDYQKDFLSTLPPCAPYIVKLRIIVRLLNDYDLIKIIEN